MHRPPLTLQAFEAALDCHGAVLAHWPAALAESAQALLATSAEARKLLTAQMQLEALLTADSAALAPPSRNLRTAILDAAPRPRLSLQLLLSELWATLGGVRIAGPAFAAALVLGVSIGSALSVVPEDGDDEDLVALAHLSDDYLEY